MTPCKFCHREHKPFYTCYEQRLWRQVREALNKNPDMEIIFATVAQLNLCNANKGDKNVSTATNKK